MTLRLTKQQMLLLAFIVVAFLVTMFLVIHAALPAGHWHVVADDPNVPFRLP